MNKISKVFVAWLMISMITMPAIVLAQGGPTKGFQNPLGKDAVGPQEIIIRIINYLLGLVFLLALLALVVGGIRMVASFGNEKGVEKAKEIIKWALIGLAITLLSWSIIGIVTGFLQAV